LRRKEGNNGNLHGTLGRDIKTKEATTNHGNGRNGVNVSDRHVGGACLDSALPVAMGKIQKKDLRKGRNGIYLYALEGTFNHVV
jgi:hypothetical protein